MRILGHGSCAVLCRSRHRHDAEAYRQKPALCRLHKAAPGRSQCRLGHLVIPSGHPPCLRHPKAAGDRLLAQSASAMGGLTSPLSRAPGRCGITLMPISMEPGYKGSGFRSRRSAPELQRLRPEFAWHLDLTGPRDLENRSGVGSDRFDQAGKARIGRVQNAALFSACVRRTTYFGASNVSRRWRAPVSPRSLCRKTPWP